MDVDEDSLSNKTLQEMVYQIIQILQLLVYIRLKTKMRRMKYKLFLKPPKL